MTVHRPAYSGGAGVAQPETSAPASGQCGFKPHIRSSRREADFSFGKEQFSPELSRIGARSVRKAQGAEYEGEQV